MLQKPIYIGNDHGGYELKQSIMEHLKKKGDCLYRYRKQHQGNCKISLLCSKDCRSSVKG